MPAPTGLDTEIKNTGIPLSILTMACADGVRDGYDQVFLSSTMVWQMEFK
jgi:hypothetical protein